MKKDYPMFIMHTVFYLMALIAGVLLIVKSELHNLEPLRVLEICGSLGGLIYLGEFFREESWFASPKNNEGRGN